MWTVKASVEDVVSDAEDMRQASAMSTRGGFIFSEEKQYVEPTQL